MYSLLLVLYYADVSVSIRINSLMIVPPNPIITAVYYVIQTNPLMITVYLGHQLLLLDIASSFHSFHYILNTSLDFLIPE